MTEFNLSEKRRKLYNALNKVRLGEITIYDMMSLIRMQDKEFIKELKEEIEEEYNKRNIDADASCVLPKLINKLAGDDLTEMKGGKKNGN